MGNAGKDFTKAKAQAQANANTFNTPYVVHGYGGVWWVTKQVAFFTALPPGATIIRPERGEDA